MYTNMNKTDLIKLGHFSKDHSFLKKTKWRLKAIH